MWPSGSRRTGRSGETPAMGWVTMYMCSQAWSGIVTPLMRPSSRAHIPAQLTRIEVVMGPSEVSTAATAPRSRRTPVTLTPSSSRAPPARAARDPHRADQVVGAHERVAPPRLLARDHVGLDAVGVGHRRVPTQLDHALG